ncbi:MAG: glycosyl transferase [Candidatus Parcubacteria bacterium]|nr:MAG: glycosyl transferase [Candidatus Parcubacteria bacterium]
MKVLIVITQGVVGGATNSVYFLAKGLKEKNIDVKVGFGEGEYLKEKLEKENIPYINFKWLKRTHNPLANLFFIFEIKRFLDKKKFDVVHFNSTNALFGSIGAKFSKSKPKTIFTFRGLSILDPYYQKNKILKTIYWCIFKFLLLFIDVPVFVSNHNLEITKKMKLTNKGVVIYNGIPEPEFLDKETSKKFFEEKLKIPLANKFIIGSIGRLDYQKNYEFLIQIFPEILKTKENAIAIIIGEGEERKKYENLIKKHNLQDKFFLIGEIKDASRYLKAFDSFVLPSRYEGMSITLIEALFAQIPILASDVGGNKEIIGEKCIYEFNNQNEFLTKSKNPQIPPKEKINDFEIKNTIDNYLKIY